MIFSETYTPGTGGEKRDWLRRFISESALLALLLTAGTAWLESRAPHSGDFVLSAVSKEAERAPTEAPAPVNGHAAVNGIPADLFADVKPEAPYYAGPRGTAIKAPEEIRVLLDPGHGGIDEGCARNGVLEKTINLSIALEVRKRLQGQGYQVIMTRDTDESLSLGERIQTAEDARADIFVSIHQNSSDLLGINGMEVYYSAQNTKADSRRLSELIHQDALQYSGAKARSIFEWETIRVIREASMPSCLIETGFLTNAAERQKLTAPAYQALLAEGIASGIDRYFRPKTLCLTYDTKIPEQDMKSMLSILKKENIRAVFFVTGRTAEADPETARSIVEAGHSLGIYEDREAYRDIYAEADRYLAALQDAYEKLSQVSGTAPILFHSKIDLSSVSKEGGGLQEETSVDTLQKLKESGFVRYEWKPGL